MKIRTDDTVLIIKGKDRGKQAKVKSVFPKQNRVIVEGINIALRHTKQIKLYGRLVLSKKNYLLQ